MFAGNSDVKLCHRVYNSESMDISEVEESLFAASDAKLHGEMCKVLSASYCRVMSIFPSLEEARPRSRSGIQALCALHVALQKAKNVLQHCSECSKLYLAITADSVLSKFERARIALMDGLRRVEDIAPQSIGCQIQEVFSELESTVFSLDPIEKQVGDDIIALLQQGRKFDNCSDVNELECFHQAAIRLGITSSTAALRERRALKKLIQRARAEEDKRKESIVAYLLHLMRKYSKLFRSEFSDDNDSQGSAPCSPTVQDEDVGSGGNGLAFDRQFSKVSSFNFKTSFSYKSNTRKSGQMALPPEELRCPISLQLMYDPVIIASGQTYERICIEKWFSDGHNTCPKSQQKLSHLSLTPNYCVKGLISSWCEQNGVSVPDGPPESLDLNYWRLAFSESESECINPKYMGSINSCKLKEAKVVPIEESGTIEEDDVNETEEVSQESEESEPETFESYLDLLTVLNEEEDFRKKYKVVEQIRLLLKDDEEARMYMGANGFVEALLKFLNSALSEANVSAQESGAMALFNLAVNNNRNKETMLASGVISLLEVMISYPSSHGPATALYLNLSCLEGAKPLIGTSPAAPFLTQLLQTNAETQCKLDALHALYNLSSIPENIPNLLSAGIIDSLQSLLADSSENLWTEKCIAVLINLAASSVKDEIISNTKLISALAALLEAEQPIEQEQAASCLYLLCNGNDKCSQMVLQEGVIPALVSMSVNGTSRGKDKAQKLLMLFREQRQRDQPSPAEEKVLNCEPNDDEPTPLKFCHPSPPPAASKPGKFISKVKKGKALGFLWKTKRSSVYQC